MWGGAGADRLLVTVVPRAVAKALLTMVRVRCAE
jgi:hypothetical protein